MTRRSSTFGFVVFIFATLLCAPRVWAGEHSLGLGWQFWRTVDGLPGAGDVEDVEDDGSSLVASYQYKPAGLFKFEIDVEYFEDGFAGSTDTAIAPQAFVLVGGFVYGGVGVGVTISDGLEDEVSDPYFMARLGLEFDLLGPLSVDLHATYRFDDWEGLEGIDLNTDTYTLGAVARIKL